MRASGDALVAFDTIFRNPFGNLNRSRRAFILRRADGERPVLDAAECGNGQVVALLAIHDVADILNEIGARDKRSFAARRRVFPFGGNLDGNRRRDPGIDGRIVPIDDVLPFAPVGMLVRLFEIAHGIFDGDDICQREERRLHDHIDARAEAELTGNLEGVDEIQFRVKLRQFPFHHRGKDRVQLLRFPRTVQKEDAAVFETAK